MYKVLKDAMVLANRVANHVIVKETKMGFRKPMDYNAVNHQIYMSGVELCSSRNDGFVQWEIKQDLYRIKWLVDNILKSSPTFSGEEEFLKDHEKHVIFNALKT